MARREPEDPDRTRQWTNGDPVTNRTTGEQGTVKWTHPRRTDGRQFLRVTTTSGRFAGKEDWESGQWDIGHGDRRSTCAACEQRFWTSEPRGDLCLCCRRMRAPDRHADTMQEVHLRLRGNAARGPIPTAATPPEAHSTFVTGGSPIGVDEESDCPY